MKIDKRSFDYIISDAVNIMIRLDKATLPVLWNYKGLFGLIPFARIQNAFENWKDTHVGSTLPPTAKFTWCDVMPILPQIANALLGEDKDDKCTYRGKDSPDTSGTDS